MKALFSKHKKLFLVLLVPVVYLIISILTLSDYGINWDSPKHFIRGQSYLHFILTGNRNFLDTPAYPALKGAPDIVDFNVDGATNSAVAKHGEIKDPSIRRSYYQSDFYTFDYFMNKHVHTHPEVNDLLVATTNYIFYQKLGVIGDIEAYHLFIVLATFALATAVALWTYSQFGVFASVVSTASLVLYPLVFAESHFNVKDPVLMSFFGLAILSFWYGISKVKPSFILLSSIFAGFALGTKFNAFFLAPILCIWLLFAKKIIYNRKILFLLLIYPLITLAVVYALSPYLWIDPIGNFLRMVNYYKDIGIETTDLPANYLVFGWNIYPIIWIFTTTPLPILFLSMIGLIYAIFLTIKNRDNIALLIVLWFTVPIIRVVWPGANIYGGVRQIMEFIPAMTILSGLGIYLLLNKLKIKFVGILVSIGFIYVAYEMAIIHPNQNVYFNQLVGGLPGAYQKSIPSWGNSYGNAYLQGINWLNKNVEPNAQLALAVNYIGSIPRLKLRKDISLDNSYFSGTKRGGEYAMELSYDWPLKSRYKYSYYDTFLEPIYQVRVDGVPLLKIWKNDLEHTRNGFEKEVEIQPKSINSEQNKLKIDFNRQIFLTRMIIDYSIDDCEVQIKDGAITTSQDGINFTREYSPLYDPESPEVSPGMDEDTFVYLFPVRQASSLIFNPLNANPCILKDLQIKIFGLQK